MLDNGDRQLLARRGLGMWMALVGDEELARPDDQPMLWSYAQDRATDDMM